MYEHVVCFPGPFLCKIHFSEAAEEVVEIIAGLFLFLVGNLGQ